MCSKLRDYLDSVFIEQDSYHHKNTRFIFLIYFQTFFCVICSWMSMNFGDKRCRFKALIPSLSRYVTSYVISAFLFPHL